MYILFLNCGVAVVLLDTCTLKVKGGFNLGHNYPWSDANVCLPGCHVH